MKNVTATPPKREKDFLSMTPASIWKQKSLFVLSSLILIGILETCQCQHHLFCFVPMLGIFLSNLLIIRKSDSQAYRSCLQDVNESSANYNCTVGLDSAILLLLLNYSRAKPSTFQGPKLLLMRTHNHMF